MKKASLLFPLLVLGLFAALNAQAAISRDATSTVVSNNGGTTASTTNTVSSNANEWLFAYSLSTNNDASATFNGVSMTKLASIVGTDTRAIALFGLQNPATGTHVLAASVPGAEASLQVGGVSYSGVLGVDATTTNANGGLISSYPTSLFGPHNNDWYIEVDRQTGGSNPSGTVAQAPATSTSLGATLFTGMFDNNGPTTPAATTTITILTTNGGSGAFYSIMAAISPTVPSTTPDALFFAGD